MTATPLPRISAELARWAAGSRADGVPSAVTATARRMLKDSLGVAARGAITDEAAIALRAVGPGVAGDHPGATRVLGHRLLLPRRDAAFVNGTSSMTLELDDGYSPGGVHPSPGVLPAVLAVVDAGSRDLDTFLHAYTIGCEVVCRVAAAAHPLSLDRGFHITPVAGVLGAAVACAMAAGLEADGIGHALGIAGSFAGGLYEFVADGAGVKRIHAGHAAASGILAADLASQGLTGPATVLEGTYGWLAAFAGAGEDRALGILDGLGEQWRIDDHYMKLYPCARHSHAPVDLTLALLDELDHPDAGDIREIVIATYATAIKLDFVGSSTELDAQMSMPYAVAAAAVHGELGLVQFDAATRSDARVLDLARRVAITIDPELDAQYPARRPARVTIRLHDGRVATRSAEGARGEPYLPLSDAELDVKFRRLVADVVGEDTARDTSRALDAMRSWEDLDAALDRFVPPGA